jgi:hypothetical protein
MALENAGKFVCPHCKGETFEIDRLNVANSHFKPYVVKCGTCCAIFGVIPTSEYLLSSDTERRSQDRQAP